MVTHIMPAPRLSSANPRAPSNGADIAMLDVDIALGLKVGGLVGMGQELSFMNAKTRPRHAMSSMREVA